MTKKQTVKKKEDPKIKIVMSIEDAVSDACYEVIKERVEEKITPEFLDNFVKKTTNNTIENILQNMVESVIDDSEECYMSNSRLEGIVEDTVRENEDKYRNSVQKILDNIIEKPEIQKKISDHIIKNYINHLDDICIFEDILTDCFDNYEFKIVPKKK